MKKRIISLIIAICCVLSIVVVPTESAKAAPSNLPNGYTLIGSSENLNLYYHSGWESFAIEDKRNGFVWESNISEENPLQEGITGANWKSEAKRSFKISYANVEVIKNINWDKDKYTLVTEKLDNGLKLTYDFTDYKIRMAIYVYLEDDALTIDIPIEELAEYGDTYGFANIKVFPYFGVAHPSEDGYVFYPDGSGALYNFNERMSVYATEYRWSVYYDDSLDFEAIDTKYKDNNQKTLMLPVFGVKRNDNAYVAVVTKGDEDTRLFFNPAYRRLYGNYIYADFVYRRLFQDARFNVKTPLNYVQKDRVNSSRQIKYFFTVGDEANYSGMAKKVREYYISSGWMASKIQQGDPVPMQIDLFMGITEDRLLVDKYIKMTTFEQAITVLETLKEAGVDNMFVLLDGWNKYGYGEFAPTHYQLHIGLGGAPKLKKLTKYAIDNNIILGLKADYVNAYASTPGYNRRADLIYDLNNILMSWRGQFLFDPIRSYNLFFRKFVPKAVKHNIRAIGFEDMGIKLYCNYKDGKIVNRYDTADRWAMFGTDVQKLGMKAAYEGGNAYLLNTADYLYNIPYEDSGFFITDQTIPFYQMVVHGSVPYTTFPGNLSYDYEWMKLKWLEFGCYPYFELSYQPTDLLMNIEDNEIFSSYYLAWIEDIVGTYKEFQQMKDIYNSYILEHEVVEKDILNYELVRVEYSNGSTILINYNPETDKTYNGITVPAKSYVVVKGGTN
ncbi:MAG: hypothetical protein GX082_04130 [Clostridiaceae bacterium]|nr:hypothetical protein [Clostridiaceae bacterium]